MWGFSGKLSFWVILIKPVGGFLITLSLSTKENAIKQKQTRLNLFIIRWASWYWPVRPGKYYSSGEREKSQELVISFPKKISQKKLFTTSRIPAQPKTKIHKQNVVICTNKDRVSATSQTHLEVYYSMVWCRPSILDKLDNQNQAVAHWMGNSF